MPENLPASLGKNQVYPFPPSFKKKKRISVLC
jgi:hypothetical protein